MRSENKFRVSILLSLAFCIVFHLQMSAQNLKVMSYNIHFGQNIKNVDKLDSMAKIIIHTKPDIVALQEVDSVCARSGNVDQAKTLAKLTGMYFSFVRHFAYDGGAYGQAILSKYPIAKTTNYRLPIYPLEEKETRAMLLAEVEISKSKKVIVGVVHLDYRNKDSRLNQIHHIATLFDKQPFPGILAGDMNALPNTDELVSLAKHFNFPDIPTNFTFPAPNPVRKIDFIMAHNNSSATITDEIVLDVDYSDHKPIMANVKF